MDGHLCSGRRVRILARSDLRNAYKYSNHPHGRNGNIKYDDYLNDIHDPNYHKPGTDKPRGYRDADGTITDTDGDPIINLDAFVITNDSSSRSAEFQYNGHDLAVVIHHDEYGNGTGYWFQNGKHVRRHAGHIETSNPYGTYFKFGEVSGAWGKYASHQRDYAPFAKHAGEYSPGTVRHFRDTGKHE